MGVGVHDEGYVDRKLTVALNKFLGSVQRVHQPEGVPLASLFVAIVCPLLAQDRQSRVLQHLGYAAVCSLVGKCQRRIVGLTLNTKILVGVVVDGHDVATGSQCRTYGHAQRSLQGILFHICQYLRLQRYKIIANRESLRLNCFEFFALTQ